MMIKRYLKQNKNLWWIAVFLVLLIKLFSANGSWVESLYATEFYPFFSRILRVIFGWIPFSIGDILYLAAACWIVFKLIKNVRLVFKGNFLGRPALNSLLHFALAFVFIYIIFNIFWGVNYNRKGIAYQLQLDGLKYDTSDLTTLQNLLLEKVNASKLAVISSRESYPDNCDLFKRAKSSYDSVAKIYPFLTYRNLSVKPSFYGWLGDYLGFTGYYNPFTGEAQVNTTVPDFLRPYITTHEMAHQLGYAKENEANFVGYLAAANSPDSLFHYSTYFDLFLYANREVYYFDSISSKNAMEKLNPFVKQDIDELRRFNLAHRSFIEPAITWLYGRFLKLNQQPQGMHTYNAVVGMLVAYYKRYGKI